MQEKEELVPVTSEDQLRVGMLVEVKNCQHPTACGRTHRMLLVGPGPDCLIADYEDMVQGLLGFSGIHHAHHRTWRAATVPHEVWRQSGICFIFSAIPEGRLFEVRSTELRDEANPYLLTRPVKTLETVK